MGDKPCPRCFIQKDQIPQIGTLNDDRWRARRRQDNKVYQSRVNHARSSVFDDELALTAQAVERVIGPLGYTTTRVR
jgi:hypothetical protein